MDINRLREFIVLSECLNYSKAANMLYLTQPVLSRHIHDLEETLGTKLFERDTHKVSLTPMGERAVIEFRAALEALDKAFSTIQSASDQESSCLSVGFLGYAVKGFITNFIESFEKMHPSINITAIASDLDEVTGYMLEDKLDLAFTTHVPSELFADFEVRHISDDPLCAVIPAGHRLTDETGIRMSDIRNEPLISFSETNNPYTAQYHKSLFEKFGMQMHTVKTINNIDSGFFYVSMGHGIFLIPRHLSFLAGDLNVVEITDPEAVIPLNLIWKKGNDKQALTTFVKDFTKFYNGSY